MRSPEPMRQQPLRTNLGAGEQLASRWPRPSRVRRTQPWRHWLLREGRRGHRRCLGSFRSFPDRQDGMTTRSLAGRERADGIRPECTNSDGVPESVTDSE
jgi:hypothetical protein